MITQERIDEIKAFYNAHGVLDIGMTDEVLDNIHASIEQAKASEIPPVKVKKTKI